MEGGLLAWGTLCTHLTSSWKVFRSRITIGHYSLREKRKENGEPCKKPSG